MARKLKITVTTASNLVVIQDYDSTTLEIYKIKNCGMGEFSMETTGNVDLSESSAKVAFIHRDGTRFGDALISDFESIMINGVLSGMSDLNAVRAALAPYFFNVGGGGYAFYKEITLTSANLLNDLDWDSGADPIVLLPAIQGGYYSAIMITHEFTYGSVAYTTASKPGIYSHLPAAGSATLLVDLPTSALNSVVSRITPQIMPQMSNTTVMPTYTTGEQIIYRLANEGNQATGDGTVKLKIWYTPATFG